MCLFFIRNRCTRVFGHKRVYIYRNLYHNGHQPKRINLRKLQITSYGRAISFKQEFPV